MLEEQQGKGEPHAGGTQGKAGGLLAGGVGAHSQALQGAQGQPGGQALISGEPGLECSGKYYSTPAVTDL